MTKMSFYAVPLAGRCACCAKGATTAIKGTGGATYVHTCDAHAKREINRLTKAWAAQSDEENARQAQVHQ